MSCTTAASKPVKTDKASFARVLYINHAAERKRILLNNLYGVDVDPQAVEVTKLSLLLKVLEGESEQTHRKAP